MKAVAVSPIVVAVLAACSSLAFAGVPTYTVTALPTPAGASSTANGVSNFGAVGQIDNGANLPALWTSSGRTDLPIPDGLTRGFANAVNNAGLVVGSVGDLRSPPQAASWTSGAITVLPTEDTDDDDTEFLFGSIASGVNAAGVIVGQGTNQYGDTGVIWSPDGGIRLLMGLAPADEYQYSWAQSINDAGTIVGFAKDEFGQNRAMRWAGDTATPLGLLYEDGETVAHDVNEAGDIVGWGTTEDGFGNAFIHSNGTLTPLPRLTGSDYGEAFGINEDGLIVGQSLESGVAGRGFATLWLDGQPHNLESLLTNDPNSEWELLGAFGIADNGNIVGFGTRNGEIAAFLLTPAVPEPAMIGFAMLALPVTLRRRRQKN